MRCFWLKSTLALLLAGALGACTATGPSPMSESAGEARSGASGVTVFGTVDVGVGAKRSSR